MSIYSLLDECSISPDVAPAIGECVDDTQNLDCLYPIKPYINSLGQLGFGVETWSFHSRCYQPGGIWHATRLEAMKERDWLLEALDQERFA